MRLQWAIVVRAAIQVAVQNVVRDLPDRLAHRKFNVVGDRDRAGLVILYMVVESGVKLFHVTKMRGPFSIALF